MKEHLNGKMELLKTQKICVEGKHEGHFFEIVLSEVMENGYLQEERMEQIQMEMIKLWSKQIEKFNRGRSSSITETNAKKLLESIYCTLGFRFRMLEDLDDSIILLQEKGLEELFEEGQELIRDGFQTLRESYEMLKSSLLATENRAYRDTYDEGLEPFFTSYSLEFESQECPAQIDYPLSNDKMEKVGIDYMIDYIEKSLLEHSLCQKFSSEEIETVLQGYHQGYRELLINIFEIVLMNAIGRGIIGKTLSGLSVEAMDLENIEKKLEILPTPLLEQLIIEKGLEVLEQLDLTSSKMKDYTLQTLRKYIPRIEVAVEEETLNTIFIVAPIEEVESLHYVAGAKLEDEAFKVLTDTIRAYESVEDKIKAIRDKVQHIDDLRDILEADCIFDEEYERVYESLEDTEIALLMNSMRVDTNDLVELEVEREWFQVLEEYLKQMPWEKQQHIKEMAQKIVQV